MTQHSAPQHSVNITEQLQQVEQNIRNYEKATTTVQTRVEGYRQQYAQIGAEIQALGVNPQTIEEELKSLAQSILTKSAELEKLLPTNLIEQMQQDLNRPVQVPVDLPDFGIVF